MEPYPEILVSNRSHPVLDGAVVSSYNFIRRTNEDLYPLLSIYNPLELIDWISENDWTCSITRLVIEQAAHQSVAASPEEKYEYDFHIDPFPAFLKTMA